MPNAAPRTRAHAPAAAAARTATAATPVAPAARAPNARRPAGRPALLLSAQPARDAGPAPQARQSVEITPAVPTLMPEGIAQLVAASGPGEPLPRDVRLTLESSFGVGLGDVRVHTDQNSAAVANGIGARAFTYGTHVYLGPRERPGDLRLLAHEVAHVIQQQGRPVVQMCCAGCAACAAEGGGTFEREASQAASAVAGGARFEVQGRTGGEQVQKVAGGAEDEGLLTRMLWSLLEAVSPEFARMLREIMREGVLEWLKGKIVAAVGTVFDALASPVRAVTGVVASLSSHFTGLLEWIREAAGRIARGDCGSITEAAERIQRVVEGLAAPVIDRIKHLAERVSGFVTRFSNRFLAPIGEFLRTAGGWAWERIQQFGRWIWEKTATVRERLSRAWRWVKNRLGIGEGDEGQQGLLQWVQRRAAAAWEWIKARIEPIKRPLLVVGGILLMLSPAGPVIAIGAAVRGLLVGIRWIRQHMSRPNGVVEQRQAFERAIIPAIMGAVDGVASGLTRAANFVTEKLNGVMAGLGDAVGAVAGSIFSFAVGLVRWLADQFRGLVVWAREKLQGLAEWVRAGLERLRAFLQPILEVLRRIAEVVGNIMRLPFLIAGRLWNAIPACIRDPFVNFFIPLILGRISLFSELVSTPEAWAQTRTQVMGIVRQIFRDHDLVGAMRSVFRLILRALAVPVDLAARVLAKAATAWDEVLARPLQFIRNILRSMLYGFRRFFGNIVSHLLYGVSGWIFNELRDVGIQAPSSWTDLRAVFGFVMQVLGVSVEHIFELLARRLPPERVRQLRRVYSALSGAWEWLRVAIEEGPGGVWRMLVERLRDLGTTVLRAAVDWIVDRIIRRVSARLMSMLDPTGVMAVVNALISLYRAIQTVVRYMRQILEIVNSVLDTVINVARGILGPAAEMLEAALHRAMPIAIAFLANQANLSGLGARMREIVGSIRERVDTALLWLIDRAMAGINALLNMMRSAAGAVMDWWRERKNFTANDGNPHTLFFRRAGGNVTLMMASEVSESLEVKIDRRLRQHRAKLRQATGRVRSSLQTKISALESAKGKKQALDEYISTNTRSQPAGPGMPAGPSTEVIRAQIQTRLEAIRPDLVAGEIIDRGDELPLTNITYQMSGDRPWIVRAEPLTKHPGNTHGEAAESSSASPPGWNVASEENSQSFIIVGGKRQTTSTGRAKLSKDWKRVHLISAAFHGPARVWNLVPARTAVNADFLSIFENKVKERLPTKEMAADVTVHHYQSNDVIQMTSGPPDDRVLAQAKKSDYPESFTVNLREKNDEGQFVDVLKDRTIRGTLLPKTGEAQHHQYLQDRVEEMIEEYIEGERADRIMRWGLYIGYINSAIRRRLGVTRMDQIRDFYNRKRDEKMGGG